MQGGGDGGAGSPPAATARAPAALARFRLCGIGDPLSPDNAMDRNSPGVRRVRGAIGAVCSVSVAVRNFQTAGAAFAERRRQQSERAINAPSLTQVYNAPSPERMARFVERASQRALLDRAAYAESEPKGAAAAPDLAAAPRRFPSSTSSLAGPESTVVDMTGPQSTGGTDGAASSPLPSRPLAAGSPFQPVPTPLHTESAHDVQRPTSAESSTVATQSIARAHRHGKFSEADTRDLVHALRSTLHNARLCARAAHTARHVARSSRADASSLVAAGVLPPLLQGWARHRDSLPLVCAAARATASLLSARGVWGQVDASPDGAWWWLRQRQPARRRIAALRRHSVVVGTISRALRPQQSTGTASGSFHTPLDVGEPRPQPRTSPALLVATEVLRLVGEAATTFPASLAVAVRAASPLTPASPSPADACAVACAQRVVVQLAHAAAPQSHGLVARGAALVAGAMARFPDQARLQEAACRALTDLARCDAAAVRGVSVSDGPVPDPVRGGDKTDDEPHSSDEEEGGEEQEGSGPARPGGRWAQARCSQPPHSPVIVARLLGHAVFACGLTSVSTSVEATRALSAMGETEAIMHLDRAPPRGSRAREDARSVGSEDTEALLVGTPFERRPKQRPLSHDVFQRLTMSLRLPGLEHSASTLESRTRLAARRPHSAVSDVSAQAASPAAAHALPFGPQSLVIDPASAASPAFGSGWSTSRRRGSRSSAALPASGSALARRMASVYGGRKGAGKRAGGHKGRPSPAPHRAARQRLGPRAHPTTTKAAPAAPRSSGASALPYLSHEQHVAVLDRLRARVGSTAGAPGRG